MSLQHLNISQINEAALQSLVSSSASESRTLEFKQDLQIATDEQKREFLSDVTAIANSDGGDLVFGIRAAKGVAIEVVGLRNFIPDDRIGQLENLLRDSVQPRITGTQIIARQLENGAHVLILRIPRSFIAPHMVRHQGVTRFCGRNSAGKYDLDIHEMRSAFLASEGLADQLRNFRLDRVNRLSAGAAPLLLAGRHLLVLHLLPVVSARPDIRLSTSSFQKLSLEHHPRVLGGGGAATFNIDGLIVSSGWESGPHRSYVQIFRSGYLEAVESNVLRQRTQGELIIPSIAWERYILEAFPSFLRAMAMLELPPPFIVCVSLLNVRGYTMYVGPDSDYSGARLVDRDHLLTDDVLVESTETPPDVMLRPLFDQIWNACGWPQSLNYKQGRWVERR